MEWYCGARFPRAGPPVGFIVTTLETEGRAVVRSHNNRDNKRGTAGQQSFKGGKEAVKLTRLSCHRFRANEVRRRLSVIVYDYDLGNVWRRLAAERMRAGAR